MDTYVQTPQDVFIQPQHLVIPPFQRPYVWEKDEQWAPLWHDVRRLAELRAARPAEDIRHFLGAIVVQTQGSVLGQLRASSIIDGQQRLTTLQVLMDAAGAALEAAGYDLLAGQLEQLTHNQEMFVQGLPTRLKLRHRNRDREAFDEVMGAEPPVDYDSLSHAAARVTRAHAYFSGAISEWLQPGAQASLARAPALTDALSQGLQIVTINLSADENPQEIFETLNARGTPLTAADLIRNLVFQRLAADGVDTQLYLAEWPFETAFWEQDITVGRFPIQRSSLFFNQWLVSEVGEEISPRATFARFKQFVDDHQRDHDGAIIDLLPIIQEQANRYEAWARAAEDPDRQLDRVERAVYRMRSANSELLKPLLLWLHRPGSAVPPHVVESVLAVVESWHVRRQLLRLNLGDMGRVVADLIQVHRTTPVAELAGSVERYIGRLDVTSTYWPGDDEVRAGLRTEQVYRRFSRARARMVLEAIEDEYRRDTNQPQVPRRGYPIEHVLPQSWKAHWPVEDPEAETRRAEHIHRLGNLTLLTTSLNAKVSNGPWTTKREALRAHDTLLLNSRLLSSLEGGWAEESIDVRSDALIDALLRVWPVPDGHIGAVTDPQQKSAGWIQVKHLVGAGLLEPGVTLNARPGAWSSRTARVRDDGLLEVDGRVFDSPSGAGRHVKGAATNGWNFWTLPDGRRLQDVRRAYTGVEPPSRPAGFDWGPLHGILEALPTGRWTTYGALAEAVGTAAQPLGNHIAGCRQCTNAHRIVRSDGSTAERFRWLGADDGPDPRELLRAEIPFVGDGPDPASQIGVDELLALMPQDDGGGR